MDVFNLSATISLNLDNFTTNLDKAQKKFKSFSDSLSGIGSGMKDVLKPAVDGFKAVESVGKKAESAITTGLKGFAAAATAVGGFGAAAVKSGMAFDATMSEVSAISGATGKDFDDLRAKALEMGAKTKFSASEAGEAMTYMAMAGWKTGDMLGGIEGIMNLAAASGEDLATTSDIVTDALTALGLQASDSGHFADVLAAASSNANTNVAMMGETFKYAAPLAGAMGYTAEDTALAIGLMANAGIKGSQSGTALRSIMTRLAKPTKESATAMDALGISITNSDGSMKPFGTTISELRTAFSGLSEEQKATYAAMLGGQEAMSGLLAIVNAAPADVEKLTNALNDCNGAAEKMAATMIDNLQGDLTLLGSAFESLQIAISDSLTPTLREFAQFGQKAMAQLLDGFQGSGVNGFMSVLSGIVTQGVTMLAQKAPEFAKVSVQFISVLGEGFLNATPEITMASALVINEILSGISRFLGEHSEEMIEAGKTIIGVISSGFLRATNVLSENIGQFIPLIAQAFLTYHETLFTVGLDILGAIGKGIIENKDKLREIASQTITNMVTALRDNAPAIIEGGLALLEALINGIVENAAMIGETALDIVNHLAAGLGKMAPKIIPAAVELILGLTSGLTSPENIKNLIDAALKIIEGLVEGLTKALPKLIEFAPEIIVNLVTGIIAGLPKLVEIGINLIGGLIEGLIQGILALPEAIARVVGALIDGFKALLGIHSPSTVFAEIGMNLIAGLLQGIQETWQTILDFFSAAVDGIIVFFQNAWEGIKSVFSGVAEFFGAVFSSAVQSIVTAFSSVLEFFSSVFRGIQEIFASVAEILGGFFQAAAEAVKNAWSAIVEFFQGVWEGIKNVFSTVAEVLGKFFSDAVEAVKKAWEGISEFFKGVWQSIQDVFSTVAEVLGGFFQSAADAVQAAWENVADFFSGVWENIKASVSDVHEAIGNAFDEARNRVEKAFDNVESFFSGVVNKIVGVFNGVKSKFASIGKNMVSGIKNGITAAWGALTSTVGKLTSGLVKGVKGLLGIASPSKVFAGIGKYMAEGLGVGWENEFGGIKRSIEGGLNFGTASIGLSANTGTRYGAQAGQQGGFMGGNSYNFTFNSPEALDPVAASRKAKRAAQMMALGYV